MRLKSTIHIQRVRQLPCCICGDSTTTEAAHVRFADPRVGKFITGIGTKPSDAFTVPLCNRHHREQHDLGDERKFWSLYDLDPILIALALYQAPDHETAERIVNYHSGQG